MFTPNDYDKLYINYSTVIKISSDGNKTTFYDSDDYFELRKTSSLFLSVVLPLLSIFAIRNIINRIERQ